MKKIIALFMSAVLLVSCAVTGVSAADNDTSPVIVVSGVGTRGFYKDYGTENEVSVFPPTVDFPYVLMTAASGITRAVLTSDMSKFTEAVSLILENIFDGFMCDENGDSKYDNVGSVYYPESIDNYDFDYTDDAPEIAIAGAVSEIVGEENTYFYNYDWRLDPCANASGLDEMIQKVKHETGAQKVTLIPCSMGGVQTVAYLNEYGCDDIKKIIFMSSAHKGLLFVSELFTGEIGIEQKDLFMFLQQFLNLGTDGTDALLDKVWSDLGSASYLNGVFSALDSFVVRVSDDNIYGSLRRIFGRMPGMWAFVRDEYFDEAYSFMIDDNMSDELVEKITYYHENVGSRTDEILSQAKESGVEIAICSHYDKGAVPLTEQACREGDSLIETVCTSNGATVAPSGETLGEGYTQAKDCEGHNHLSADNKIDASTCLFPDSTWFIKGASHVGCKYGSDYSEFIKWLVSTENTDVFANEAYPQFMQTDNSEMTLRPVDPPEETGSWASVIALVIEDIKNIIFKK